MSKMTQFEESTDYTEYRYTCPSVEDPRVVAVITRDTDPHAPDGDAYAPTFRVERGRVDTVTSVYVDPDVTDSTMRELISHWGAGGAHADMVARALGILYGVRDVKIVSGMNSDAAYWILDTPTWREHVGVDLATADTLTGEAHDWQAYLDGDVYGVGVLVNLEHVLPFGPDDDRPTDDGDGWEWHNDGQVWGYYGDEYAAGTALDEMGSTVEELRTTRPMLVA